MESSIAEDFTHDITATVESKIPLKAKQKRSMSIRPQEPGGKLRKTKTFRY